MPPLLWGLGVILLPRSSKIRPISKDSDFRRVAVRLVRCSSSLAWTASTPNRFAVTVSNFAVAPPSQLIIACKTGCSNGEPKPA